MWITDWSTKAMCRETDPDALFVQGAAQNRAKLICRGCPVRAECLADALDNRIEFGVWGGMTERERRALLRRRPDVTSWRALLETARDAYEREGAERGPIPRKRSARDGFAASLHRSQAGHTAPTGAAGTARAALAPHGAAPIDRDAGPAEHRDRVRGGALTH
ncbi:WhiB family redox-sensing transcriptional regulator [Nocardiopsis mwathae]|uniref:Transcriptional regulator WhiB n=1 Tax=Nocardiopsis mwathae TaxID=1472723 RepID=A0A7W9YL50_9ACTN|nr:WhiB family redox-sensing transcriptional regulator [Nocardiopsis mwathae]